MLNAFAPINFFGNGILSYNLLKAYGGLGNEIALSPPFGSVAFDTEPVRKWLLNRAKVKRTDPGLMIFDIPFFFNFSGMPKIGFAVFETDGFTDIQRAALASCDFLLTPSDWGRRTLAIHGFTAEVVPEGFDASLFRASDAPAYHKTCFVHVGKFEERKGTISVIQTFLTALKGEEAMLVMHAHNPFLPDTLGSLKEILGSLGLRTMDGLNFFRERLEVKLTPRFGLPTEAIANLYRMADCGIFPSKGEGWGLPLIESIASGVPVIAGRWTAMGDYITPDYPQELVLENTMIQPANEQTWYFGDRGNWHVPDEDEIVEKIRWAYENIRKLRATEKWTRFVCNFRARWTWERAALRLDEILRKMAA